MLPVSKRALFFLPFLAGLFLPASGPSYRPALSPENTLEQKGLSYACWAPGLYADPGAELALENLSRTGAGWIALVVTWYQNDLGSLAIAPTEGTPTDSDLAKAVRTAHALGLKVMLKPHLDLWSDSAHWRGQIGKFYTTESQWQTWFAAYRAFIEHFAALARDLGAEQFCIGCELEGTSGRTEDWRRVVAGVRALYRGPILYAANHSGEELRLDWWDAVDYIGVDAYYPLATHLEPTARELAAAWAPKVAALGGLAARWGKPLLLTEVGYRSLDGACMHPWDYQIRGEVDLEEQADAYRAVREAFSGRPWFSGIYWWSWSPDPYEGGPDDDGFTPHDKPAEDVVREWYGAPKRRAPGPAREPDPEASVDICSEGLGAGWRDGSWNAARDLEATGLVRDGAKAVAASLGAWGGLGFERAPFAAPPRGWLALSFYPLTPDIPRLWVYLLDASGRALARRRMEDRRFHDDEPVVAGRWNSLWIPLRDLGLGLAGGAARVAGVVIQDSTGLGSPPFRLDDVRLVGPGRRPGPRRDIRETES